MFRRWRRARLAAQASAHAAAPTPRPTAADLRGEHLFELLNAKLSDFIGPGGTWSLVRRTEGDTEPSADAQIGETGQIHESSWTGVGAPPRPG